MNKIKSFSLGWRFTDPRYNVLPPRDLIKIRPNSKRKSNSLFELTKEYAKDYNLNKELVKEIEEINLENGDNLKIGKWIKDRIDKEIVIIWNKETSVTTEKEIFIRYLDDFLYPSSDDVIIKSIRKNWIMYYMHTNILYFGEIKKKV